jgi:hypothetical protein
VGEPTARECNPAVAATVARLFECAPRARAIETVRPRGCHVVSAAGEVSEHASATEANALTHEQASITLALAQGDLEPQTAWTTLGRMLRFPWTRRPTRRATLVFWQQRAIQYAGRTASVPAPGR